MTGSDLRNAWFALWRRLGADGEAASVYDELLSAYSEPGRAYHTLAHIEHCLSEFAIVSEAATNPDAIEFALWFHDAVYDTRSKDNEERSAELARKVLRSASLSDSMANRIADLILVTKHSAPPVTLSEKILVDRLVNSRAKPLDVRRIRAADSLGVLLGAGRCLRQRAFRDSLILSLAAQNLLHGLLLRQI